MGKGGLICGKIKQYIFEQICQFETSSIYQLSPADDFGNFTYDSSIEKPAKLKKC